MSSLIYAVMSGKLSQEEALRECSLQTNADGTIYVLAPERPHYKGCKNRPDYWENRKTPKGKPSKPAKPLGSYRCECPNPAGAWLAECWRANVAMVNRLDRASLLAVAICVQKYPFPGIGLAGTDGQRHSAGGDDAYTDYFRWALVTVRAGEGLTPHALGLPLGDLRVALVKRAATGVNAPTDSYLRAALADRPDRGIIPESPAEFAARNGQVCLPL